MEDMVKRYCDAVIYRQGFMMLLVGPTMGAMTKLQGSLLTEEMLMIVMMVGSVYSMCAYQISKALKWNTIFMLSLAGNAVCTIGLFLGYMANVPTETLVFIFPISNGLFMLMGGIYGSMVKNIIKDKAKDIFNIGLFENKKMSVGAICGLIGQGTAVFSFATFEVNLIWMVAVLELVKTAIFYTTEIRVYKMAKHLDN